MAAFVQQIMGLPMSLHVRAADPHREDIEAAVQDVWSQLRTADQVFSTWRADSDLMRLRAGTSEPYAAHPWIAQVRQLCERAERASGGIFTTDLVGPDGSRGWDPTGLVKGWSVQQAVGRLRTVAGIVFSLNAGGDIVCGSGEHVSGIDDVWRVGIEDPAAPGELAHVIPVFNGALATSGTAARGHHIIDPRTGEPVRTDRTSTTVTGPDLTWCDMWATVSFIDPSALARAGREWSAYRVVAQTP